MTLSESMKLAPKGKALKLCTWNAQGLFLHAFSAGVRAGQKFRELQRLCEGHAVVCIQEAHGVSADLESLRTSIPSHSPFGSFCANSGTGGVVTMISKTILDVAEDRCEVVIVAGRCMIVNVFDDYIFRRSMCTSLPRRLWRSNNNYFKMSEPL